MLSERIKILQDAGLIGEESAGFAEKTGRILMDRFQNQGDAVSVFVTHLAMAVQRIMMNEQVDEVDDIIWQEVKNSEHCQKANELLKLVLAQAPCEIPESERRFLIIHLCNIYNS